MSKYSLEKIKAVKNVIEEGMSPGAVAKLPGTLKIHVRGWVE